jgi:serine/threonine-protein kinase HipA
MVKSTQQTLLIFMNGRLIGQLTKHSAGALSFRYDDRWLQQPGARPLSLSLPLVDQTYTGDLVYHFFDNLLPDNPKIRARIQTKFQRPTAAPFDLLASIGRDCVGAIQLCEHKTPPLKTINAEPLSDTAIANILKHFKTAPLGMMDSKEDFRLSIAGAQEKTAFLHYKKQWCRPLKATPTTHIFKLPIGFLEHQQMDLRDSCENEWLCLQIAKAFGLPTASANIASFDNIKTLVVKRFDRQWSQDKSWLMRLPQEDMCQALGISPNLKYESDGGPGIVDIMQLLLGAKNSAADREFFFRAQILFYLLAAIDGHAKNFSLFIEPFGAYRLTPLYDIMSAHPLLVSKQLQKEKIKMAMALIGKNKHYRWHSIKRRHFLSTAAAANFPLERAEKIIQTMCQQVEPVIDSVSNALPASFPSAIASAIFNGMRQAKQTLKKATPHR